MSRSGPPVLWIANSITTVVHIADHIAAVPWTML